ncbi:alpha/beta hydrolase [Nocardioides sp.]|uniref:alpha/beta hydrolase n=1 Tax=Nocardioides sp. TaxID=35761 RepID=UPI002728168F|nr:alpha/beta hydrolase [Nocardioides sp.]MDO9454996.1 alpha/beta hydrolase [Nocardioides sp.]
MLFPDARAAVEAAAGDTPVHTAGYDVPAARAAARALAATLPREDVADVVDVEAGGVPCRLFRPADAAPGVVVHVHGGGFVFHDVEVHDAPARRLANRVGVAVLSVDYRLAPEHPYPAPVRDLDAVVGWLGSEAPTDLAGPAYAHGDSAGAQLALVTALRHPGRFAALALVYPFLDPAASAASHRTESSGLGAADVAWYWRQYAGDHPDLTDPDLAPLASDRLGTLPPTYVATAEHDPARDEGERLASLVAEAGVEVVATRWLGQPHGFWRHDRAYAAAEPLMVSVAAFLRSH